MTYTMRHLPHWHPPGATAFITWRLHGSMPAQFMPPKLSDPPGKRFLGYDKLLDQAQCGPLWIKDQRVANCILSRLRELQRRKLFLLRAYVLMANHVHVLLDPQTSLSKITQQIKGATSREANLILGRTSKPFWQDESFDHWVRDPAEWQKIRAYIEANPVKAGLVASPKDWPWSSASNPFPIE